MYFTYFFILQKSAKYLHTIGKAHKRGRKDIDLKHSPNLDLKEALSVITRILRWAFHNHLQTLHVTSTAPPTATSSWYSAMSTASSSSPNPWWNLFTASGSPPILKKTAGQTFATSTAQTTSSHTANSPTKSWRLSHSSTSSRKTISTSHRLRTLAAKIFSPMTLSLHGSTNFRICHVLSLVVFTDF